MSHPPSTPVKVPASATTYTAATQDPDLRSQINTLMLRDGQITKIQDNLLHSLDAHNSNWPSAIQSHALALLRSGEVSTFPALMRRVLEDVRRETSTASTSNSSTTESNGVNGSTKNGSKTNGTSSSTEPPGGIGAQASLAIPPAVIEALLKAARESLEAVCEVEDGPTGG